jgi:hypothetical protein
LVEFIREFDEGANSKQKRPINKKYWTYLVTSYSNLFWKKNIYSRWSEEEYAECRRVTIPIEVDDLLEVQFFHFSQHGLICFFLLCQYTNHQASGDFPRDLVENVCKNTARYIKMFSEVCSGPGMPVRDPLQVSSVEDAVMQSR